MQPALTSAAGGTLVPVEHEPTPSRPASIHRSGAIAIAGQGIKLILQLGSTAALARLLSPTDFGLYSLVTPIAAFFLMFRDLGLTSATIFTQDITDAEVTSLFWISTATGIVLGLAMLGIAPLAAAIYEDARLTPVLSLLATMFVCNGISAQYQALLQRRLRFKALVTIDVGSYAGGIALGVLAAVHGFSYWSLVLIPITTQALSLVASVFASQWQPGLPRWEARTAAMTRFGSNIAGFNLLNFVARNADNLLIGKFWGLTALGFYGRAYSLLMAPLTQVIYPLNKVVVPVLTRLNADRDAYTRTYRQILSSLMLACYPLITCLIVAREAVIDVLLGPQWQSVAPIFLALGFAALVQPINNATGWLLLSQGRARDTLYTGVMGCVVCCISFVCGLPWGPVGVAIAYAIAQIAVATPLLWWLTCRSGFVSARVLLASALPVWTASAFAGLSFELLIRWLPPALLSAPVWHLMAACAWVAITFLLALSAQSRGRDVLRTGLPTRVRAWIGPS